MKNIFAKLALFFIFLICISSILSFFTSAFFTNDIENEMQLNQQAIAISILELKEKTDLSLDEILDITSTHMYNVRKFQDIDLIDITEEQLQKIHNNEIVSINHGKFEGTATIIMVDNYYVRISLHPHNNTFKIIGSRLWFTVASFICIGAILIILSGKTAVKPILELTSATKEVAKGNFDIQVETKADDEIGQLAQHFNKMTRELKNIEYLRKDFITNVSHEFKTPIASIQGFAKLLQKGNLSEEEKQEYTNIIVEETTRLSNLSSNILKLSKLENQEILEKRSEFYLDEQIRKCILLLEHQWAKKNIEFDIELEKIQYTGDEGLLQQVWINILSNAIKFSNNNSKISIDLKKTDTSANIKITDYGIGMREETMVRIFEKFYQGDKSHSYEGNGLGLPLVKRILDICGGRINVESQLNKGTTFTVELQYNERD